MYDLYHRQIHSRRLISRSEIFNYFHLCMKHSYKRGQATLLKKRSGRQIHPLDKRGHYQGAHRFCSLLNSSLLHQNTSFSFSFSRNISTRVKMKKRLMWATLSLNILKGEAMIYLFLFLFFLFLEIPPLSQPHYRKKQGPYIFS
jgi:hypothetical protein